MNPAPLERIGALSDSEIDLADAALELGALDRPGVSLQSYRDHVLRMVDAAINLGRSIAQPHEQATLLSYVLFRRHGYEGDRATYEDPANANLLDVIDRKRGLPVSLSILYLSIARLAGWHADGLNVPAHFLIRVGEGAAAVLQDPFDQGKQITASSLEVLVRRATGGDMPLETEHLQALSNRAILIRLLNNIAARAERTATMPGAQHAHAHDRHRASLHRPLVGACAARAGDGPRARGALLARRHARDHTQPGNRRPDSPGARRTGAIHELIVFGFPR
ncbi:hypothetical protein E6W36_03500 [Hankyongella ginsenosidimutans]|uniref:Protein SirB1 N-terminal domain-containing protein n=1 Tax=Hankyongella ginsenosidimutans TaxID=1763828 RepID=A0A4D7CB55_9SPHN|nr:transglutaminase-like domain-containing protein [Hankyongella ginsenosidimutans]QCI78986.1 hypothetical protein E6W36_03500 [Hankyongella ginsenosidimutans]